MARCRACGKEYRKGVLATLLTPGGKAGAEGARVCSGCARGGVLLVAPRVAAPAKRDAVDKEHPLAVHIVTVTRQLRVYARAANVAAASEVGGSPEACHHAGRAEAFEGAIELLKLNSGGRLLP
jgi:hypothetical protein